MAMKQLRFERIAVKNGVTIMNVITISDDIYKHMNKMYINSIQFQFQFNIISIYM